MTTVPGAMPKIVGNPNCAKCHGTGMKKKLLGDGYKPCSKCRKAALAGCACNKCGDTGMLLKNN